MGHMGLLSKRRIFGGKESKGERQSWEIRQKSVSYHLIGYSQSNLYTFFLITERHLMIVIFSISSGSS